ncbi:hypothetical protein T484DRAFT_1803485 [Baffinella frigidus]|nr:hypothetical protein T484DRAFT_1803485 [Cryptophyta sp. CCMP2293]
MGGGASRLQGDEERSQHELTRSRRNNSTRLRAQSMLLPPKEEERLSETTTPIQADGPAEADSLGLGLSSITSALALGSSWRQKTTRWRAEAVHRRQLAADDAVERLAATRIEEQHTEAQRQEVLAAAQPAQRATLERLFDHERAQATERIMRVAAELEQVLVRDQLEPISGTHAHVNEGEGEVETEPPLLGAADEEVAGVP